MAIDKIGGINTFSLSNFDIDTVNSNENKGASFSEYLNEAVNKVNDLQMEAEYAADGFAAGKIDNIHEVLIAGEKADVALQLTMQIRNKLLDAYNEIMRMQI